MENWFFWPLVWIFVSVSLAGFSPVLLSYFLHKYLRNPVVTLHVYLFFEQDKNAFMHILIMRTLVLLEHPVVSIFQLSSCWLKVKLKNLEESLLTPSTLHNIQSTSGSKTERHVTTALHIWYIGHRS